MATIQDEWDRWVNDNTCCPECGATVSGGGRELHRAYHRGDKPPRGKEAPPVDPSCTEPYYEQARESPRGKQVVRSDEFDQQRHGLTFGEVRRAVDRAFDVALTITAHQGRVGRGEVARALWVELGKDY